MADDPLEPEAIDLVLQLLDLPDPVISSGSFDLMPAAASLERLGLFVPAGYEPVVWDRDSGDDDPVLVTPSEDEARYGRFSGSDGWVSVAESQLARRRLDLTLFTSMLVGHPAKEIVADSLWDLGTMRLPHRARPVRLWLARRVEDHWDEIRRTIVTVSYDGLTIVLTGSTMSLGGIPPRTTTVSLVQVIKPGAFTIEASLLAMALADQSPMKKGRVRVLNDGREVWLDGERFNFAKGAQQRRVIAYLEKELRAGRATVPTAEIVEELGIASPRIRDVFKDNAAWGRLLDEKAGLCGFCLE